MKKIAYLSLLLSIANASNSQTSTFDNLNANLGSPKTIEWYTSNFGDTQNPGPKFGFGHKIYDQAGNGETYLKIAGKHYANSWKDLMTIASTGKIGIGTALPSCMLDIVDATKAEMKLQTAANAEAGVWVLNNLRSYGFRVNAAGEGCITQAYGALIPQTGKPYELLNFTYDVGAVPARPQVWIGGKPSANTPHIDFMFAVKGKLLAKEIIVTQQDWSDFVFDKDYKLIPLNELENFYKENHHLPEVPSTKEITEYGNDLGKTDALLLQKIEELTLYMVNLNKKIEVLENENQLLKEKVK